MITNYVHMYYVYRMLKQVTDWCMHFDGVTSEDLVISDMREVAISAT